MLFDLGEEPDQMKIKNNDQHSGMLLDLWDKIETEWRMTNVMSQDVVLPWGQARRHE